MNTKRTLLLISNILSYVFCFLYFVLAALFYSAENKIYFLFFGLAIISIVSGLLVSNVKDFMYGTEFTKNQKKQLIIYSIFNIVSPLSTILNIVSLLIFSDTELTFREYVEPVVKQHNVLKHNFLLTVISLCIIILSSFIGRVVETSGFTVEISKFYLTKEMSEKYGQPINGTSYIIKTDSMKYCVEMYKPKEASEDNLLPVIFVNGGYTRSMEAMDQFCIELSRRGAVVFVLDSACHGESTYAGNYLNTKGVDTKISTADAQWGLEYLISYVYNNTDDFNFIDRNRFGSCGHSQGGAATMGAAKDMAGDSYETSILKAIQISGYCTNLKYYSGLYKCNALCTWGLYEEGYPDGGYESYFKSFVNNANGYGVFEYNDIEYNKGYGSIEDGTYRMVTRPATNHYLTIYSSKNIQWLCDFFADTLGIEHISSQTWVIKEVTGIISFAAAFAMLLGVAGMLLKTRFFSSCKLPEQKLVQTEVLPNGILIKKRRSLYTKLKFWLLALLTAIIACLDYIPLCDLGLELFSDTANAMYTWNWPCKMFNGVMLWALVNGLIGLLVFFIPKIIEAIIRKIKHVEKPELEEMKPLKVGIIPLLKTILLAIILFLVFFIVLDLVYLIFHQEYSIFMVICSPINLRSLLTYFIYVPFFIFFYIQNSIRVNCGIGFEGWKEPVSFFVAMLANSLGLVFIILIKYGNYWVFGSTNDWNTTMVNVIFGVLIMMAILPILNRLFYKKSNQVYLGAITILLIFIYISVSSTCNLVPLSL